MLHPFQQGILSALSGNGIGVVDQKHDYELFAAAGLYIASYGFYAFQCAGLQVSVAGGGAFLEAFFCRTIYTQYRQRGDQLGT